MKFEKEKELAHVLNACLLAQPTSSGEYVHLMTCSGDRREPAGKPGFSCSCAIAPKSAVTDLRAALAEKEAEIERLRQSQ